MYDESNNKNVFLFYSWLGCAEAVVCDLGFATIRQAE